MRRCVEAAGKLHNAVASLLAPAVIAGGRSLAAQVMSALGQMLIAAVQLWTSVRVAASSTEKSSSGCMLLAVGA